MRILKNRTPKLALCLLFIAIMLSIHSKSFGLGLEVDPGEISVFIDSAQFGKPVAVSALSGEGMKLIIKNKGASAYTYTVDILPVSKTTSPLKEGFIDIPDTSWVYPENKEVMVEGNSSKSVDLYLNIPKKKQCYNKNYQAVIEVKNKKSNPNEIFILACQLNMYVKTGVQAYHVIPAKAGIQTGDSRLRGNDNVGADLVSAREDGDSRLHGNDNVRGNKDSRERQLTVHLQEVFDAKISITPFEGGKAINLIAEAPDVKGGKAATLEIPDQYLPGEFVLRIDYRAKEADSPYPSERIIFINKQDIELTVNPPYINNDEKTKFNTGETENTVYSAFMKENSAKRMQIDLLKQFLLSYDRPSSEFYTRGTKEFEQRRQEYNQWLSDEAKKHSGLYVGSLFQFQYVPVVECGGSEDERLKQIIKNYFDGIDFNDPLIIRSRQMSMFMDSYMGLYGMQAKTEELRNTLFTEAGHSACEKASKGDPKVYGWMVDYFYKGYETYQMDKGITMLEQHINNPNCLTSKKQQIIARLNGMTRLVPGSLAPDFIISDNQGHNFEFHKWKGKAKHKLLLFWSSDCTSCRELVSGLAQWHNKPANKKRLDIAAINLDETETAEEKWKTEIATVPEWQHFYIKEGVNSPVAREYSILSTPVMFLIDAKRNTIVSVLSSFEELMGDLEK